MAWLLQIWHCLWCHAARNVNATKIRAVQRITSKSKFGSIYSRLRSLKRFMDILPLARARRRSVRSELARTWRLRGYPVPHPPRCRNGAATRRNWADAISFPATTSSWQPFAALWTRCHCRRRCPCQGMFSVFSLRSRLRTCRVRLVHRGGELPNQVPDSRTDKYKRMKFKR